MSLATPCPPQSRPSGLPRLSIAAFGGFPEDTADIDYTRAIQDEIRTAKPKRRQTINRRIERNAPVAIFEDIAEGEESVLATQPKRIEGKTLLGKKAQRIPPAALKRPVEESQSQPLRDVGQARRRPSIMPDDTCSLLQPERAPERIREGRRRTIFVPNDATALLTIHPGARIDNPLDDTFNLCIPGAKSGPTEATEDVVDDLPKFQRPLRRPRKSLSAAPRRIPLQQMSANWEDSMFDVAGANTGKENLPPHAKFEKTECLDKTVKPVTRVPMAASRPLAPNANTQRRQSVVPRHMAPVAQQIVPQKRTSVATSKNQDAVAITTTRASIVATKPALKAARPTSSSTCSPLQHPSSHVSRTTKQRISPRVPIVDREQQRQALRQMMATQRAELQISKLSQYPVLTENLAHPELYEDEWLSHQEVALTETINAIFHASISNARTSRHSSNTLRERMISLYHRTDVTMLYKRLQASLVYGALSHPQGPASCDLGRDLGMRKKFLALWLDTYDEAALKTAAEVVVGRQISRDPHSIQEDLKIAETVLDPLASRRQITAFLETFFITVSDVDHSAPGEDSASLVLVRWRKTMLRSLMLIWLLDHSKTEDELDGRLFQTTSTRKSSISVLHALSSLLLPSVGDISRASRHMDYEVTHVQDPLDEVRYHVENIAIDLRDGVVLAHLIDTLLYQDSASLLDNIDNNATVTFALPDTTVIESALNDADNTFNTPRILSRHLKMPCIGRAQKLYNVQISLSALEAHSVDGNNAAADIQACDIVDGHREKTLSLLWSLVGHFGLSKLVDWTEIVADIQRKIGTAPVLTGTVARERHETLLQCWAEAYCAPQGIRISNLTSSFADGKAYAAIVNAFARYSTDVRHQHQLQDSGENSLKDRLLSLGCSAAFTEQLTSTLGVIPDRKTTICNIAFLASRLLPLARAHLAATTLQRAFRRRQQRILAARQASLLQLAQACATVVQTRNRIVSAAETLQRAWRGVLASRIAQLNLEVGTFQALARAWAVRRDKSSEYFVNGSAGQMKGRTMAGW